MARDYYEILGVPRDAPAEQIKTAYRKLAIECHPDRCPGDREAEERFKQAAEAYDVLRDPEKRQRYDMFGPEGLRSAGARTFSSFDDIFAAFGDIFGTGIGSLFGDLFGGAHTGERTAGRRARGSSLRCEVAVTFEEAAEGVEKTIVLRRSEHCESCSGTGAKPGTSPKTCPMCNGRGEITRSQGFFTIRSTCPRCSGRGEIVETPCKDCRGTGLAVKEREITVKIPPGIEDSTRLRIPGEGEPGQSGGPSGDLYCFISLKPHALFDRRGDDLIVEVPVSFTDATLGKHIEVPTLHGLRTMRMPPGTQSGTILRLKGQGFPNVHGYGQGDQLVRIVVEVPKKLSKEHRKLIRNLADIEVRSPGPQQVHYRSRLREHYKKDSKS